MAKLNRDEILHDIIRTLVDGWGKGAVLAALEATDTVPPEGKRKRGEDAAQNLTKGAKALVAEMELPLEHRQLILDLAIRFDDGSAFPKVGDVRRFLLSHQQNANDIKSRVQGFKRMLPILSRMSPKGLERLIARSHHSGPADLGEISDAIRGAGEDLRGKSSEKEPVLKDSSESKEINEAQASVDLNSGDNKTPEPKAAARRQRAERWP